MPIRRRPAHNGDDLVDRRRIRRIDDSLVGGAGARRCGWASPPATVAGRRRRASAEKTSLPRFESRSLTDLLYRSVNPDAQPEVLAAARPGAGQRSPYRAASLGLLRSSRWPSSATRSLGKRGSAGPESVVTVRVVGGLAGWIAARSGRQGWRGGRRLPCRGRAGQAGARGSGSHIGCGGRCVRA